MVFWTMNYRSDFFFLTSIITFSSLESKSFIIAVKDGDINFNLQYFLVLFNNNEIF